MSENDSVEIKDLDIPDDAAALVMYANGTIAMHLPKQGDDDDEVADNVITIAAFGALLAKHPERVQALIESFMEHELGRPNGREVVH